MNTYQQAPHPFPGAHPGQASTPSPMMPGPTGHTGSDCGCTLDPSAAGLHSGIPAQDPYAQHSGPGMGVPGAGYGAASYLPAQAYAPQSTFLGFNFQDQNLWKGVILGAAVTFLLTNDSVQKSLIKGTAKLYGLVQGGVQEIKEKFEDVQAEMRQEAKQE